ncbi:MAG: DUF4956 domain-containing protein [Pseudomonadota bacterium]
MSAIRLIGGLALYYIGLVLFAALLFKLFPGIADFVPVGRVQTLIAQAGGPLGGGSLDGQATGPALDAVRANARFSHVDSLGASMVWLLSALAGALVTAWPAAWVYTRIRHSEMYDQSLVSTIIVLPVVVTSIVVIVQSSLALAFSLAGIAGVARYRNSMKSSGDLMFILLAIGIGLAAGIGAVELAFVTSIVFNLCFILLWASEFGERSDMKRYLHDFDPDDAVSKEAAVVAAAAAGAAVGAAVGSGDAVASALADKAAG